MYTVICDNCGADSNYDADYSCWSDESYAEDCALESGWIEHDGEHIINPYTEVSEINLNRIEDPTWKTNYLAVMNQFRDLCETFNCQYIRLISK